MHLLENPLINKPIRIVACLYRDIVKNDQLNKIQDLYNSNGSINFWLRLYQIEQVNTNSPYGK